MKHVPYLLRILPILGTSLLVSFLPGVASGQTADPATADLALSTISVSSTSVSTDDGTVNVTVQIRDEQGNSMDKADGDTIEVLGTFDGVETVIAMTSQDTGEYTGTLTNTTVGEVVISATLNGEAITGFEAPATSSNPTVTFNPGAAVASASTIAVSRVTATLDDTVTVTVQAVDAGGNRLTSGGLRVEVIETYGEDNSNTLVATYVGDGAYTANLTRPAAAGPVTVSATLEGVDLPARPDVTFFGPTIVVRVDDTEIESEETLEFTSFQQSAATKTIVITTSGSTLEVSDFSLSSSTDRPFSFTAPSVSRVTDPNQANLVITFDGTATIDDVLTFKTNDPQHPTFSIHKEDLEGFLKERKDYLETVVDPLIADYKVEISES